MARQTFETWDEQVEDERERRIKRALATFSVHHMNNTKWREVLTLLASPDNTVLCIRLKFIDNEHVIDSSGRFWLFDDACDGFPGPFEYREIEWLEVPERYFEQLGTTGTPPTERRQDVAEFRRKCEALGRLPIRDVENGFRIVGHE